MVLYRGNDLGLEGQDTNSEARDIYKYIIYIYICKSQRIFCFHIQLAFFYYYARYIYIYIYFFLSFAVQAGGVESEASRNRQQVFSESL